MAFIRPKYSRRSVNKAGDYLVRRDPFSTEDWDEYFDAWIVLDNWRASHNYILNTFQATIRGQLKELEVSRPIVAQRLKRTPSILTKLKREPHMKLSTMQDIGGLRIIVPTIVDVYDVSSRFVRSRFKHTLVRRYDYIEFPKDSGYRGVHFVYKYRNARAPAFNDLRVEVQIRNQLQHSWATAVEIMGVFLRSSLKSSEGPEEWLDFFALAGSAFALFENCNPLAAHSGKSLKELAAELRQKERSLNVLKRLTKFSQTVQAMSKINLKHKYYILHLKPTDGKIYYWGYGANELDRANEHYVRIERRLQHDFDEQAVLVSGGTFKDLKKAYPNYFLDSHLFASNVRKVLKSVA